MCRRKPDRMFISNEAVMKKVMLIAVVAIALLGLTGCMKHTFDYPSRQADGRVMEETSKFYLFGLIDGDKEPFSAYNLCNGPVKSVETFASIGNSCVGCVTLNIYAPNTVEVKCASGTAHNFYLDEDDAVVLHEVWDEESGEILETNARAEHL